MTNISIDTLKPSDLDTFKRIADWYLNEWKIPVEKTMQKLKTVTEDPSQLQLMMCIDGTPVSCAGVYHHVGLLDKEPRFSIFKNWLALVYTIPGERQKGYGALLCRDIEKRAKEMGMEELYLFTDTAEKLYKRLGWSDVERLKLAGRNIVVMKNLFCDDKGGIKKNFIAECTEMNSEGKFVLKASVDDTIKWIADKIDAASTPLFASAFTGMHDKNGKPIHEGDSVKLYYKGQYVICQVIYDAKHAAFFLKWPDGYVNQYFMNDRTYEIVSDK